METINTTQALGLAGFGGAALAALGAGVAARPGRGVWIMIALIHAGLVAEVLGSWRFDLLDRFADMARAAGEYQDRRAAQAAMIAALAVGLIALAGLVLAALRGRGAAARITALATLAALALFALEIVSLHAVDRALYRPTGPAMLIGWLWLGAGGATVLAALAAALRRGAATSRE